MALPLALFLAGVIALSVLQILKIDGAGCWWLAGSIRNESLRIARDENQPAKMCYMFRRVGKYVEVFYPSDEINKFSEGLSIRDILRSDRRALRSNAARQCFLRSDNSFADIVAFQIKSVTRWQRAISDFAFNVGSQMFRWSSAGILPARTEAPIIQGSFGVKFPKLIVTLSKDKGSLISYEASRVNTLASLAASAAALVAFTVSSRCSLCRHPTTTSRQVTITNSPLKTTNKILVMF
jgi:hypothetical protein